MDVEQVSDQESFVRYLVAMRADIKDNPDELENTNLDSFLEAVTAWLEDSPPQTESNPWRLAAVLFRVGTIYE
jgi:hypothetical protein